VDLTFHDLRHDFAHRALEAGWTLEEVAYASLLETTNGNKSKRQHSRRRPHALFDFLTSTSYNERR
jgi:hypothetical protein